MQDANRLHAIVSHAGNSHWIEPGAILTIGRHLENDIVIASSSVSRYHAQIQWLPGLPEPGVVDLDSQNGTFVGAVEVGRRLTSLGDGAQLWVGTQALEVCLRGGALLGGEVETMALFSEQGLEMRGRVESGAGLARVLRGLEGSQRTGTVRVTFATRGSATITLGLGKIVAVTCGDAQRTRALERLLLARSACEYVFTPQFEPTDGSMDLWFSDFFRRWQQGRTPRLAGKARRRAPTPVP